MGLWSISQWENPQHATGQGSVPSNKQTLYNYVTLSPIVLSAKSQNTELSDWATSHIHPTGSILVTELSTKAYKMGQVLSQTHQNTATNFSLECLQTGEGNPSSVNKAGYFLP